MSGSRLYADCLLSMELDGMHGQDWAPTKTLCQGCLFRAMLLGLFFQGLHQHLESAVLAAGIALCSVCSRDLVYAVDVSASSKSWSNAFLIDALAACFGMLHMEIQCLNTKVMPLFAEGMCATTVDFNGLSY